MIEIVLDFLFYLKLFPTDSPSSGHLSEQLLSEKSIPLFAGRNITQPFCTLVTANYSEESGFNFAHQLRDLIALLA